MTYSEVKSLILGEAKRLAMYDQLHELVKATSFEELVYSLLPHLTYFYKSGFITETILDEFDTDLLADHGIYYKRTETISLPPAIPYSYFGGYEIWILFESVITTSFSGSERYKINILDAEGIINIEDTVYADFTLFNGTGQINLNDNSVSKFDIQNINGDEVELNLSTNAIAELSVRSKSVVNVNHSDSSFVRVDGHHSSIINSDLAAEDENKILFRPVSKSKINYLAP